jgi:hypothetical protein
MRLALTLALLLTACTADKTAGVDADGDGFGGTNDCDDASSSIHPGADEVCDGIDNDCSGLADDEPVDGTAFYADDDADGHGDAAASTLACDLPEGMAEAGDDCDDTDARVHPGAEESDCADPIDYDCDGSVGYADADGDGYAACAECDDATASVHPDATESCDGVDDDCDGETDETGAAGEATWYADADGDGYGDPAAALVACGAPLGYVADAADCDDAAATAHPGGTEVCDAAGVDEDCDGFADDADAGVDPATFTTFYTDADADGYGVTATATRQCAAPAGSATLADDCDDAAAAVNPGATEVCDGATDEDCDGLVDDADPGVSTASLATWYLDSDGDGYGGTTTQARCAAPASFYLATAGDCDDTAATIHPGGTEVCDSANADEDCDGFADDLDAAPGGRTTWYADADADGYGLTASTTLACDLPAGYSTIAGDCDDASAAANPGVVEVCDAADTDEDCDGAADDADPSASPASRSTFYADADGDGYGASATTARQCDVPAGYVADATDCDDSAAAINPAATEVCDSADADDDCDGMADDADPTAATAGKITTYADTDGDGYGNPGSTSPRCDPTAGWVTDYTDCDDGRSGVNPGVANESCTTGFDDDCDGFSNEVGATACADHYVDADSDSYGAGTPVCTCAAYGAYTATTPGDCDEAAATINPAAAEVCDGVDQDCDSTIDDGMTLYYTDSDADGYGDDAEIGSCTAFSGSVTNRLDCDDDNAAANPGATEICDAYDVDEDCNGYADDSDPDVTGTSVLYVDADLDGYGDESATGTDTCEDLEGYVDDHTDCDDTDADVNPAASERYGDSVDDDCDGSTSPSRTYCTPNVGSGRTYASISAAVSAHATSICLGSGTYSYTSSLNIPLSGQGMDVSTYSGNMSDDATDVKISGTAIDGTYTRVHITGSLTSQIGYGASAYDSIIDGGVIVYANASSSTGGCSMSLYNCYIRGGANTLYVYANGNYVYGRTATATMRVEGCTLEAGSTGLYYLYADDRGTANLYMYNTVYETGTTTTYEGYWASYTNVYSAYNSSSSALLDYDYTPPRPTGGLINGGSSSYGETTDFWGVTRTGAPDIGAVEY